MDLRTEIAVVGGGPAGAAAAITLARAGVETLLIEAGDYAVPRIGETFPPAVADLLADLGVLDRLAPSRLDSHGVRSVWGGPEPQVRSHVLHPRRVGWHVDRAAFDQALAQAAAEQGARLLTDARLTGVVRVTEGWRLSLSEGRTVTARRVIDATGRRAAFARKAGARRIRADALVAVALRLDAAPLAAYGAYALIEAAPRGWWYSAPIPGGRAIAVLFSDPVTLRGLADTAAALAEAPLTAGRHAGLSLGRPARHPAGASLLDRPGGPDWLAVGDAAMTFDPMSGDGVCRALRSGVEGAGQIMASDAQAHAAGLAARFEAYARSRQAFYDSEGRWPDQAFWRWTRGLCTR